MPSLTPDALPAFAAQALAQLRAQKPLVQCITNSVTANFTANVLLALGATPAMVSTPGEAGHFAAMASGLLINLGSPVPSQGEAVREAVAAAHAAGTPWVLDPVAVGALPLRTALAQELLPCTPSAIRGNASEVLALAGTGQGGRGVDATDTVAHAAKAAQQLAQTLDGNGSTAIAISGATDCLTNGRNTIFLANGSPLLTQITGGGCALGGVIAAFLALAPRSIGQTDTATNTTNTTMAAYRLALAASAVLVYTIAAEVAAATIAQQKLGPGSFSIGLIDQLALLQPGDVIQHARIERVEHT